MAVVTFRLEKELYGVPIAQVQEVIICKDIAKSFEMPEHVVGIYNLRGSIIPVIDLKSRLGMSNQATGEQQILVCRVQGSIVGFIVDEVVQVLKIPRDQLKPPPTTLTSKTSYRIIGIAALPNGMTTIIDIVAGVSPASAEPSVEEV